MKKVIMMIAAVVLPYCAMAQKTYVNIVASGLLDRYHSLSITGDVPSGIKNYYDPYTDQTTLGDVINKLVAQGFVVEQMSCGGGEKGVEAVLLYKTASPDLTSVRGNTMTDKNSEVVEVARFNLQGIPVRPQEKGVQIVVYSNYTTRTVIVE